jgi:soluble lytic murein transglycosylase-like protein
LIRQAATKYGVDEDLVHSVISAESDYDPNSHSSAGAMGLMQLMPATVQAMKINPWDPAQNINGGVRELRGYLDRFKQVDLALAAYNAGPGAVHKYGGVPPYRETQAYVKRVLHTLWERKGD